MRVFKPSFAYCTAIASWGIMLLLVGGVPAPAQGQQEDPVENLRQIIKKPAPGLPDVEARKLALEAAQQKLKTPNDLRLALALTEWKDTDITKSPESKVDREIRTEIGKRLEEMLKSFVKSGNRTSKIMVATSLGEMGTSIRGLDPDDKSSFASSLAPTLDILIKSDDPQVSQTAARAMGKINPEPKFAVAALSDILKNSKNVGNRRAAADALGELVTTIARLEKKSRATQGGGLVNQEDVIRLAGEVVPAAGSCLQDSDVAVRRSGADALLQTANTLMELIPIPKDASGMPVAGAVWTPEQKIAVARARAENAQSWNLVLPLLNALKTQDVALAGALDDRDPQISVLSRRALEQIANSRLRLLRLQESVPTAQGEIRQTWPDPLLDAVKPSMTKIVTRINDPNQEVRRAIVSFLEALEGDAAPGADALITALGDRNKFIRWAAARALGKVGLDKKNRPEQSARTVAALATLLNPDEDPDVRKIVANTLNDFGSDAKGALPALIKMLNVGEAEAQEDVILAIKGIGGVETTGAIKALIISLDSRSPNVRRLAAEALGSMGPRAMGAVEALLQHQQDDDSAVRLAISDAVLNILRPQ
jgi:HEAT repeat protein